MQELQTVKSSGNTAFLHVIYRYFRCSGLQSINFLMHPVQVKFYCSV
jgi:hypothetical protein